MQQLSSPSNNLENSCNEGGNKGVEGELQNPLE